MAKDALEAEENQKSRRKLLREQLLWDIRAYTQTNFSRVTEEAIISASGVEAKSTKQARAYSGKQQMIFPPRCGDKTRLIAS